MKWLVIIRFKPETSPEALQELLPAERARIAEMLAADELDAIYVGKDHTELFLVLTAPSHPAAELRLTTLPMHPFMLLEWHELEMPAGS